MSFGGMVPGCDPSVGSVAERATSENLQGELSKGLTPPSVRVNARAPASGENRRGWRARGRLLVSEDAVVFSPSALSASRGRARELTHAADTIELIHVRRRPPWANTFLFLVDGTDRVRLAVAATSRNRLRRALHDAGLQVRERSAACAPAP